MPLDYLKSDNHGIADFAGKQISNQFRTSFYVIYAKIAYLQSMS